MKVSLNNCYFGIPQFKIPNVPYAPFMTPLNNKEGDTFELSNVKNYREVNSINKKAKTILLATALGALAVGLVAVSPLGAKYRNWAQVQKLIQKYNKFDMTPVLDKIPEESILKAQIDKILSQYQIAQVFDEKTATKADILSLINDKCDGVYSWGSNDLATEISRSPVKKRALNNILSLFAPNEDGEKLSYHALSSMMDSISDKTEISEIDGVCKLTKYLLGDWGVSSYGGDIIGKVSADYKGMSKTFGLLEYLTKAKPELKGTFDPKSLVNDCKNLTFENFTTFLRNLRMGSTKGCRLYIDSTLDFNVAARFLSSLNENSTKMVSLRTLSGILSDNKLSPKGLSQKLNALPEQKIFEMYTSNLDAKTFFEFEQYLNYKNINELTLHQKRELMKSLVKHNSAVFCANKTYYPILPSNNSQYCKLLDKLTKSIGIGTKPLTPTELIEFDKCLASISTTIANLDLSNARLQLVVPKEAFVSQAMTIMKKLSPAEQNKVMDYFGFYIKDGVLSGYPINVNNGEKLSEIKHAATKRAIEKLRPIVENFSSAQNTVKIQGIENAQEFEKDLNELLKLMPELRSIINRTQHRTHAFTLDIHTLKVLQQVCADPKFAQLSDGDKKILQISTLLHDITKAEGLRDSMHPSDSAFDAYYIIQKLNLSDSEQLKVYELIKSHNWLGRLNDPKLTPELRRNLAQDIAFDARHTNTFELAKILCEADLKSVKRDSGFFSEHERSLKTMADMVDSYIAKIRRTQIVLPQVKVPRADMIRNGVVKTHDGVTNVVLYISECDTDLSKYGFEKGTTKSNFLALIHALEREEQMRNFDTFSIIDTDALLSSSYIKANDYAAFRKQGLILRVAYDDIHAGYYRDFGSGFSKDIELLKEDYLFTGERIKGKSSMTDRAFRSSYCENYRTYISDLIKKELKLTDEQYIELMEKIKDCQSITDIEKVDKDFADGLLNVFKSMQNGKRKDGRQYNEMLASRPRIQGVFAYDKPYERIPLFLRKFAQDNNIPILIFGPRL